MLFEVISEKSVKIRDVSDAIQAKALEFLGQLGMAKANLKILKDTWDNKKGIISVNHEFIDEVRSVLAMVEMAGKDKIIIKTIKISGLINKLNAMR